VNVSKFQTSMTRVGTSYWNTGNDDRSATREVFHEKTRVARDLIKSHPLTPELSAELFAQKAIGAFWFSAALIEWLQSEVEGLQKTCEDA